MPAPNNKADRETLKALVRVKLAEGKPYRTVASEVGVSLSTIHRWNKQTVKPDEMEAAKNAITALDLQTLSKTSLINRLVLDAIIEKANNGELDDEDIKTLSRVGVDTSKIHGIHWDKVMLRDGTLAQPIIERLGGLLAAHCGLRVVPTNQPNDKQNRQDQDKQARGLPRPADKA